MTRLWLLLAAAGALAVVLLTTFVRHGERVPPSASLAEAAAHNYRTLSVAESRTLMRYAQQEYRCLTSRGARVSRPVPSRIRIVIAAPNRSARELARLELACDPAVGPPPAKATLQARKGLVLVYLQKFCLLDAARLQRS